MQGDARAPALRARVRVIRVPGFLPFAEHPSWAPLHLARYRYFVELCEATAVAAGAEGFRRKGLSATPVSPFSSWQPAFLRPDHLGARYGVDLAREQYGGPDCSPRASPASRAAPTFQATLARETDEREGEELHGRARGLAHRGMVTRARPRARASTAGATAS